MLQSLYIKDFALIESLELKLGKGFTVITGETGAGKSIIIDAFLAALGERTSSDAVRSGASKAIIELVYDSSANGAVRAFIRNHEYDDEQPQVIVRREMKAGGNSRFFINDSPATAAQVRELGMLLVDFHGQYEHQSVLRASEQLRIVDALAHNDNRLLRYRELHATTRILLRDLNDLRSKAEELRASQDYRRARLDEIAAIDPRPGEEEELQRELGIIGHAEELHEHTRNAYALLYANDDAIIERLAMVRQAIANVVRIDPSFAAFQKETEAATVSLNEVAKAVRSYIDAIDFDPARIETIRERLVQLQRLRKRYGSVEKACQEREDLERSLSLIENFDEELERLQTSIRESKEQLLDSALELRAYRRQTGEILSAAIVEKLKDLGIPHASFVVECSLRESRASQSEMTVQREGVAYAPNEDGIDEVRMVAAMNVGESVKPLEKVLSGGEASRIMLAIKSVMAASDNVPILVFDEIDTGISGRISRKVGEAMKVLSASHQVLVITHQAIVASLADHHILVRKFVDGGRTHVSALAIEGEQRVTEIASLLGGDGASAAARLQATELLAGGREQDASRRITDTVDGGAVDGEEKERGEWDTTGGRAEKGTQRLNSARTSTRTSTRTSKKNV